MIKNSRCQARLAIRFEIEHKLIRSRLERIRIIFEERIVPSFEEDEKYLERQLKTKTANEDDYAELEALKSDLTEVSNLYCVAIWNIVESHLKMIGKHLDNKWGNKWNKWDTIKDCYKDRGIDLTCLQKYRETNILHLINNCIKHTDSIVSEQLESADSKSFKRLVERKKQKIQMKPEEILSYIKNAELFLYAVIEIMEAKFQLMP